MHLMRPIVTRISLINLWLRLQGPCCFRGGLKSQCWLSTMLHRNLWTSLALLHPPYCANNLSLMGPNQLEARICMPKVKMGLQRDYPLIETQSSALLSLVNSVLMGLLIWFL